jgi:hypothetical protein
MSAIPIAAWEQAVIIVLVFIFLIVFIGRLTKLAQELKRASDDTNAQFQAFLIQRDRQWQEYLSSLRKADYAEQTARESAFAERNSRVVEATDALAGTIRQLTEETRTHHTEMRDAVARMDAKTRPAPAFKKKPE